MDLLVERTSMGTDSLASTYYLAAHVCAAVTPSGTVLLDLKQNRYRGVATCDAAALTSLIADWPSTPAAETSPPGPPDVELVRALESAGLLARAPCLRPLPVTPNAPRVTGSVGEELGWQGALSTRHAPHFVRACLRTRWLLRSRSLLAIVADVHQRARLAHTSQERAIELAGAFRSLRAYAFSAKDQCLFHALALRYFLLASGVDARWIIGVRTQPWMAHSWVQDGTLALDSSPERVCDYTPILAA